MNRFLVILALFAGAMPVSAQLGKITSVLDKGLKAYNDHNFTDEEEKQLGAEISARLRDRYGVVQDREVHKYVALTGMTVASASTRPNLSWTFVVLDTDGVNAFAAPGGFVHVTRGALALIQNESELANVLGHEIGHITIKHTIKAIQKANLAGKIAASSRTQFIEQLASKAYEVVIENNFDRDDEDAADRVALGLANKVGYSPAGMVSFLTQLSERNKGLKERSGFFASHPAMTARIGDLSKIISSQKLTATALVAPRYTSSISFKPVPVGQIAQAAPPSAPAGSTTAAPKSSGAGTFGISGQNPLAKENTSNATIASAGSRGLNPDRDARGGPNKALVVVSVSAGEVAAFRNGIS